MAEFAQEFPSLAADVAIVAFFSVVILAIGWFVVTNVRDIWRAFVWATRAIAPPKAVALAAAVAPIAAAPLLPADVQWSRVTGVVTVAAARARVMKKLHGAASEQVDAAHYALKRLSAELQALLAVEEFAPRPKADVRWLQARRARRDAPRRKLAA